PTGILQREFFAHLIRKKRHVADHQRALTSARDQASVIDHLVHGYGQGVGTALHDAAQRIADQEHFHAGFVENPRKGIIVCREASDLLAALLHLEHVRHRDLVAHDRPPNAKKPSRPSRKANAVGEYRQRSPKNRLLASVSVQITWIQAVCSAASPNPCY